MGERHEHCIRELLYLVEAILPEPFEMDDTCDGLDLCGQPLCARVGCVPDKLERARTLSDSGESA